MTTGLLSAHLRMWFVAVSFASIVLASSGCSNETDTTWSLRSEVMELPATQQQAVRDFIGEVHGTYNDPRMRTISDEEEVAESEDDEEDADDELDDEDSDDDPGVAYKDLVDPLRLQHGREVFNRYCVSCHGVTGDGQGPAAEYLYPPPRDYRPGVFKFTSTPDGIKPRREDIRQVIYRGAKGTSMPAFRWLSDEDMEPLIDYVMLLSRRGELELALLRLIEEEGYEPEDFEDEETLEEFLEMANDEVTTIHERWESATDDIVMPAVPMPPVSEETILSGQALFFDKQQGCYKCHGADGRGGIEDEDANLDAWGQPIIAANLTTGMYHGGGRPIDLYRRIHSGISSRMPAFGNVFADDPEKIWHLVHFVQAFGEGREIDAQALTDDHEHSEEADPSDEADGDDE